MNRREFTASLMASAFSLPLMRGAAVAASSAISLTAQNRTLEINKRPATVMGLLQKDGTQGVRILPDQDFDVALTNKLDAETLIHWHGMLPPWPMDGVPNLPSPPLSPGETRHYKFPAGSPGTHWMHAHSLQEQLLLAAPLIVYGKNDLERDEQDAILLLHDFAFDLPEKILSNLQTMNHSNHSAMMAMDVNDVDYDAYLANDRTLDDPEILRVEKGGRVRLRIINAATATAFTIDVGALKAEAIAVDGNEIEPIKIQQIPLTMAQRVDLRIEVPSEGGAFPILALREGALERTGIIFATSSASIKKLGSVGENASPILTLDLEARFKAISPLQERAPDRAFSVMLMGNMMGYQWGIESAKPLIVKEGERVEIDMMNHSMMAHPMHLHGHHFQITAINGMAVKGAVRDTVLVPPMSNVRFAFDAHNPGKAWAFHCHNLYHMAAGMMTHIGYEGA